MMKPQGNTEKERDGMYISAPFEALFHVAVARTTMSDFLEFFLHLAIEFPGQIVTLDFRWDPERNFDTGAFLVAVKINETLDKTITEPWRG